MRDYESQKEMKENYGKGPTTGNAESRSGKRAKFKAIKAERLPLANHIMDALTARSEGGGEVYMPRLEGLANYVKPKKFSR